MKKILIYYPFQIGNLNSGSGVRPNKMLLAFREYSKQNNIELIEIYGENKERAKKINEFMKNVNSKEVIYCYVEDSTMPFWFTDKDHLPRKPFLELKFFKYLRKNRIPIGLFYRDVYWKFDDIYPLKGLKRMMMRMFYRAEHRFFAKYVDHFFLPSVEMNKYTEFPKDKTTSLPPGGENLLQYHNETYSKELNMIYVGGISGRYGLDIMLKATEKVYLEGKDIKLHLVCRKEEYEKNEHVFKQYKDLSWLTIYHAQGDELKEIYQKVDLSIIPIRKNTYNDFAVPIKLFEYLSYGLPIITTNCNAQARIIKEDDLGIVVDDDVDCIAKGIKYFFDEDSRSYHSNKVKQTLLNKHLWKHRVKNIEFNLLKSN